jgi:hypothetical protein
MNKSIAPKAESLEITPQDIGKNRSELRSFLQKVNGIKVSAAAWFTPEVHAMELDPFMDRYEGIEGNITDFALMFLSDQMTENGTLGTSNEYEQTASLVSMLSTFGFQSNEQFQAALTYLQAHEPTNNRERAIKIRLLRALNQNYDDLLQTMLASKNTNDGGYGIDLDYGSDILTTVEVLSTLTTINYAEDNSIAQAIGFLVNRIPNSGELRFSLANSESNPSYYLANRVLQALKPFEGTSVGVDGNLQSIDEHTGYLLAWLYSRIDTDGSLAFTNKAIDYLMTAQSFDRYAVHPEEAELLNLLARGLQQSNGSFGGSIEATILAARKYAGPDIEVTSVAPDSPLANRGDQRLLISFTNAGYLETTDIDIYVYANNVEIGRLENLQNQNVVLDRGDSVSLNLGIPLDGVLGDTEFIVYVEASGDAVEENNWFERSISVASASTNIPALPTYYEAHKPYNQNEPLIYLSWEQFDDPNRQVYAVGWRPVGGDWNFTGVSNSANQFVLSSANGLVSGQAYDVFVGPFSNGSVYPPGTIATVTVDSSPVQATGIIRGTITDNQIQTDSGFVDGLEFTGEPAADGTFELRNIGNGRHALSVERLGSYNLKREVTVPVGTIDIGRLITHLAKDDVQPVMTSVLSNKSVVQEGSDIQITMSGTDNQDIEQFELQVTAFPSQKRSFVSRIFATNNQAEVTWSAPFEEEQDQVIIDTEYQFDAIAIDVQGNRSEPLISGNIEVKSLVDGLVFTEVGETSMENNDQTSDALVWFDYDNDGDEDVFVARYGKANSLYENLENFEFREVSAGSLTNGVHATYSASAVDYDNDGDLDLFTTNYQSTENGNTEPNILYINSGDGSFDEDTQTAVSNYPRQDQQTSVRRSFGHTWLDYDRDGLVDLYVGNFFQKNQLYKNLGSGFALQENSVTTNSNDRTFGVGLVDANNDGYQDLFVANAHFPNNTDRNGASDSLYFGNEQGGFTVAPQETGEIVNVSNLVESKGAVWGDYDNDGDMDAFVLNMNGKNQLHTNIGNGTFEIDEFAFPDGYQSEITYAAAWVDIDNDADLDLYVGSFDENSTHVMYMNVPGVGFSPQELLDFVAVEDGVQDIAFVDMNGDGLLDVHVGMNQHDYIFQNESTVENNYIAIKLEGVASNKSAIGAVITVTTEIDGKEVVQTRQVVANTGIANGNASLTQIIGVGTAQTVSEVEIIWPNGNTQIVQNLAVNQKHFITEEVEIEKDIVLRVNGVQLTNNGQYNQNYAILGQEESLDLQIEHIGTQPITFAQSEPRITITQGNVPNAQVDVDLPESMAPGQTATARISYSLDAYQESTFTVSFETDIPGKSTISFDVFITVEEPRLINTMLQSTEVLMNWEDKQTATFTFEHAPDFDDLRMFVNYESHSPHSRAGLIQYDGNEFKAIGGENYGSDQIILDQDASSIVYDADQNQTTVQIVWAYKHTANPVIGNTISLFYKLGNITSGWVNTGETFNTAIDPNFDPGTLGGGNSNPSFEGVTLAQPIQLLNGTDEQRAVLRIDNAPGLTDVRLFINYDAHSAEARGGLFQWDGSTFKEIGGANYGNNLVELDVIASNSSLDQDTGELLLEFVWTADYTQLPVEENLISVFIKKGTEYSTGWINTGVIYETQEDDAFVLPPSFMSITRSTDVLVADDTEQQSVTLTIANGDPVDLAFVQINRSAHSNGLERAGLFRWNPQGGFVELGGANYGSDHVVLDQQASTSVVNEQGDRIITFVFTASPDYPAIAPENTISYLWKSSSQEINNSWTYAGNEQNFEVTAN